MKDTQTLSRQRISLLRHRQLEVKVNVVAIKATIVATKSEENDKNIVATQKRMLQHNIELKANITIATIKAAVLEISIATEKFYVATENRR